MVTLPNPTLWPRYSMTATPHTHFLGLVASPYCLNLSSSTSRICLMCSLQSWLYVPLCHLCNNFKNCSRPCNTLFMEHWNVAGAFIYIAKPKWHCGKFEFTPRGLKRCLCGWSLLFTGICKNLLFLSETLHH